MSEVKTTRPLRPYQVAAIEGVLASFMAGHRRVVVQLPTGAGKTLTASRMIAGALRKGKRAIFTAPAISLIDQTVAAFEAEGITGIGVMQASHPRTNPRAPVQIASVQTLARREIPDAALVIVDECHIRAEAVEALMRDRPDVFFVGLSATPWAKGMGLVWQDLVTPVTIGDLIAQGILSRFTTYAPEDPDLTGVKKRAGEYVEGSLFEAMATPARIAATVENWLERGQDRPTLAFAVNRLHASMLEAEFRRRGVPVAYIDGETPTWDRQAIAAAFRRGDVRVICSVRTMTTGVDLPVSCIVDAAPTTSEILHVQKIGRGLRVNAGTEDCLILDHAGNSLRLGLVTDIQHTTLDAAPPEGKTPAREARLPSICGTCGLLSAKPLCPACGTAHAVPPAQVEAEATVEVGPLSVDQSSDDRSFFAMMLRIAEERRFRNPVGFAANAYRTRFGGWPPFRGESVPPMRPTPAVRAWAERDRRRYLAEKGARHG